MSIPNTKGSVGGGDGHGFSLMPFGELALPLSIGTFCMFATTAYFYVQSLRDPSKAKLQYVAMSVTGIATVAYLCMRANIGVSYVECAGGSCGNYTNPLSDEGHLYPLFWMRYVDWFFTTPFFLLDLCLLANAENEDTFFVMLMNALCITCGAVGALKPSVNIPFFTLGMVTFAMFIHKLFKISEDAHYQKTMKITMLLWAAYPIMFVLCEMTKSVTAEIEVWLYCVLDVAAKCGCGFLLVSGHSGKTSFGAQESYGALN